MEVNRESTLQIETITKTRAGTTIECSVGRMGRDGTPPHTVIYSPRELRAILEKAGPAAQEHLQALDRYMHTFVETRIGDEPVCFWPDGVLVRPLLLDNLPEPVRRIERAAEAIIGHPISRRGEEVTEINLGDPVPTEELTALPEDLTTIQTDTVIAVPRGSDPNTFRYVLFKELEPYKPPVGPLMEGIRFQGVEGVEKNRPLFQFRALKHPVVPRVALGPTAAPVQVTIGDKVPLGELGDVPRAPVQPNTVLAGCRSFDPTFRYVLCKKFTPGYQQIDKDRRLIGAPFDGITFDTPEGYETTKPIAAFRSLQHPVVPRAALGPTAAPVPVNIGGPVPGDEPSAAPAGTPARPLGEPISTRPPIAPRQAPPGQSRTAAPPPPVPSPSAPLLRPATAADVQNPPGSFVTDRGVRLLAAPQGPDGYYVVDLAASRRPLPNPMGAVLGANRRYRHGAKDGQLLITPQRVRQQYPIRPLPAPPYCEPDALGVTEDGKHVLHQPTLSSSEQTAVDMLLLDKGKTPEYYYLMNGSTQALIDNIKDAKCEGRRVDLSKGNYLEEAEKAMRNHESIIIDVKPPGHREAYTIILDKVDLQHNEVTIRDPMYGAMLTIPAADFLTWLSQPLSGYQIVETKEKT